jgi:hypothetical protein
VSAAPRALAAIAERLRPLLPTDEPGLDSHAAFERLGSIGAPNTIRMALALLERDGVVVSRMAPGRRNQPTRYFRLAQAGDRDIR